MHSPETKQVSLTSDSNARQANIRLATKYACHGPRYTSYPTAPQFSEDFPLEQYKDWQAGPGEHRRAPLSLYIHLPFCQDICYYCACNKTVTRKPGVAYRYLDHLLEEIALQSELVGSSRPVTQMHWGGGTPTFLDNAEITELMHGIASHFALLDKGYREYSIEIDPRTVDESTIALLKGLGFNRISLGIQDFDPLVQKSINRIQPYRDVASLVQCIRSHDFRSLSFDLIYGLPHQDRQTIAETLRKVISLAPDRIACYNYAHLPDRFPSQRAIDRMDLPSPEEKLLLHEIIADTLQEAGYLHIGMDHFVLPGDELAIAQREGRLQRNFQGYSLRMADDLLGLGASAISQMGDYYVQNERDLDRYYDRLQQHHLPIEKGFISGHDDRLRKYVIMSLISDMSLDMNECNERFGIDFKIDFNRELQLLGAMELDGLLSIDNDRIQVTDRGRPFLRNICMPFDAYLTPGATAEKGAYSATV